MTRQGIYPSTALVPNPWFAKPITLVTSLHDVTMSPFRPARGARIETAERALSATWIMDFRPARGARIETVWFDHQDTKSSPALREEERNIRSSCLRGVTIRSAGGARSGQMLLSEDRL